jgi:hypothetical protein
MATYIVSSFNEKKRVWEYETDSSTLKSAKDRALYESRNSSKRFRVVKEEVIDVYRDGKKVN